MGCGCVEKTTFLICNNKRWYVFTRSGPGTAKSSPVFIWSRLLDFESKRSVEQQFVTNDFNKTTSNKMINIDFISGNSSKVFDEETTNHWLKINIYYMSNSNNGTEKS
jgi:hypothetical protein